MIAPLRLWDFLGKDSIAVFPNTVASSVFAPRSERHAVLAVTSVNINDACRIAFLDEVAREI